MRAASLSTRAVSVINAFCLYFERVLVLFYACWAFFVMRAASTVCFMRADSIFIYARCLYFVRVLPLSFKHTTFIFYACCCYFFYMNCLYFACVLYRFSFAHAAAIFVHVTHVRVLMLCMCCLSTAILTESIFV